MAIELTKLVWGLPGLKKSDGFVLLSLADHAKAESHECWPSVKRIATHTWQDERTVRRSLRKLEALGLVSIEVGRPGTTSRYHIHMEALKAAADAAQVVDDLDKHGGATPPSPESDDPDMGSPHPHMGAPCPPHGGTTSPTWGHHAPLTVREPEDEPEGEPEVYACAPAKVDEVSEAVTRFNEAAEHAGWPKVQKVTGARRQAVQARLKDCDGLEGWTAQVQRALDSDFLCARTAKPWHGFGFDWLMKPGNFTKLMEGNYDNRQHKPSINDNAMFASFARVVARREAEEAERPDDAHQLH